MAQSQLTYLITGSAVRIGRSIALKAASEGSNIIIHFNKSRQPAKDLAAEVEKLGVKAFLLSSDLQDPHQAAKTVEDAWQLAGSIDVLVNNASIFDKLKLFEFTADDLVNNVMLHAYSPLVMSKKFADLNKTRAPKTRPVIINMLDTRIIDNDKEHIPYQLSKRMLFSLTKLLAIELAPAIRVNAVAPGLILPPAGQDISYLEKLRDRNVLHDIGNPDYVSDAVSYLVHAQFVTGQVIYIDGGRHLNGNIFGI
jgi:NAD(P)-dependent dehydrogenase (short-subunit alcohol dehydrogenase family)